MKNLAVRELTKRLCDMNFFKENADDTRVCSVIFEEWENEWSDYPTATFRPTGYYDITKDDHTVIYYAENEKDIDDIYIFRKENDAAFQNMIGFLELMFGSMPMDLKISVDNELWNVKDCVKTYDNKTFRVTVSKN